jgi:hypothetical protein
VVMPHRPRRGVTQKLLSTRRSRKPLGHARSSSRREKLGPGCLTYVELRVLLGAGLEGVLAGLPLVLARVVRGHGGVPSARDLGGAEARGGAEGGASGDGRHGGRGCERVVEWRGAVVGGGGV